MRLLAKACLDGCDIRTGAFGIACPGQHRLGLFVGSFDLAGAVAVSGMDDYDVIDVLDSLVSKNLLVPEASEWADVAPRDGVESGEHVPRSRYRMLESVRMYAAEQLTRRGEAAVAEHRYVEHHRRLTHADSFAEAASLDRALELDPESPEAHTARGLALSANGRPDEAREAFEVAIRGLAIPEPSTAALLGIGLLGLAARRRRSAGPAGAPLGHPERGV